MKRDPAFALLLAALVLALYGQSLGFGYVYDDHPVFVDRPAVHRGLAGLPELFSTDLFADHYETRGIGAALAGGRYRPLVPASMALEVAVAGKLRPRVGHAVQVLLYAGVVCGFYALLRRRLRSQAAAQVGSLLFLLHPQHVEVVANLKSRDELLCLGFTLFALLATKSWQIGVGLAGALLSKETGILLWVWLPVTWLDRERGQIRNHLLMMFAVTLGWALLRTHAVGWGGPASTDPLVNPYAMASDLQRVCTALSLQGRALLDLLRPLRFAYDYSYPSLPYRDASHPTVWSGAAAILLLGIGWLVSLRGTPTLHLGLGLILLPLLLVSNLVMDTGNFYAERTLFLPSAGFCLLLGCALDRPWRYPTATRAAVLLIALAWGSLTLLRLPDWQSEERLYLVDLKNVPTNPVARNNAGHVLAERGDWTQAREHFQKAVELHPTFADAQRNLALAELEIGRLEAAEQHFAAYRQQLPRHRDWPALNSKRAAAYIQQGLQQAAQGELPSAETSFRTAMGIDPKHAEARARLAQTLRRTGRDEEAKVLEQSLPDTLAFPDLP
jgi:tetratricopeptide (TPR) repeat protein